MISLVLATLVVIAPDGWVEDPARVVRAGALEATCFRPADDPSAFFVVMRLDPDQLPEMVIARVMQSRSAADMGIVILDQSRSGAGRTDRDVVRDHRDGTHSHTRILSGADRELLVGICRGRRAELSLCEAKLDTLTVRTNVTEVGYMSDLLLWIAGSVVVLGIVGYAVIVVLRRRRLARSPKLLEGTQLTISGVVQASPAALEAPLSGRRCLVHRSRARVLVRERVLSEPAEVQIRPFVVETRNGPVRIDVRELALEVPPDSVVDRATERQLAFRSRHEIPAAASVAFDEIVIEPGSKVTIKGIVTLERDPDAVAERGYRDDAPSSIRLVGDASRPLTLLKIW